MSDWQVGDLALCVDDAPVYDGQPVQVTVGQTYRVGGFSPGRDDIRLHIEVNSYELKYYASRFRKIQPDKHESCEPEFVRLLKRSKVTA